MGRGRRASKHARPHRPLTSALGSERVETGDGSWVVRTVPGGTSDKSYICPGCQRPVPAGTGHVVAWPTAGHFGTELGVGARRHWHTACWRRR
ncbi:hypothetical protein [Desertihabitans aurantiacus]|uniref:hypothetical protein n=1 Tax=Desertihabitans aurantiacus TaxID=2282477 RepID=UPI000DF834E7|nr:hypothetical protein [Desertihabitans aurantiacus]